jgi:hypothetical protein
MKKPLTLAVVLAFGSSAALADSHAEKKKAPAPEAKKAPEPKKEAPKAMELPKPAPEIAQYAKSVAGTWRCTGKGIMDPAKPTEMVDLKATIANKVANDLDKWWVQTNFSMPMGKSKMKFVSYTTFNTQEKKWFRYSVDSMGGAEWTSSTGPKDGKLVWEGESQNQTPGMTKVKVRHTEDLSDPKNMKAKGELSMDGKTWIVGYEATCKK